MTADEIIKLGVWFLTVYLGALLVFGSLVTWLLNGGDRVVSRAVRRGVRRVLSTPSGIVDRDGGDDWDDVDIDELFRDES